MLVTFRSKAWSSITVFGDVAVSMLKMAGHGGSIPGAIAAEDVPAAHERLRQAMVAAQAGMRQAPAPEQEDEDSQEAVRDRALRMGADHPLVQLFAAAAAQGADVTWNEGAPAL